MERFAGEAAVLVSGGLDSAILVADLLRQRTAVHPLYLRQGYYWEGVELDHLRRYLAALGGPGLMPLRVLEAPVGDLLAGHWAVTGRAVPDADSPDEAVFLPARNVLLLSKAMLWCHLNQVPALALGTLRANPFPDATPAFFDQFQAIVNQALGSQIAVWRPYAELSKPAVLERGRGLPLDRTFSCLRPDDGRHCGACNKCAERKQAFAVAGLADPTPYAAAHSPPA